MNRRIPIYIKILIIHAHTGTVSVTKRLRFAGNALKDLRAFPAGARREAGYQLHRVQNGLAATDWKAMSVIGPGVREIRIHHAGEYRVIYGEMSVEDAVYVLHAFRKKTMKTRNRDVEMIRRRLAMIRERGSWQ